MTQFLHLQNTIWSLIFPLSLSAFSIIVMRTFFQTTIPDEIIESAKMDGAGEFLTFARIVLPVSLPGIATIGLFSSLGYWNDWFNNGRVYLHLFALDHIVSGSVDYPVHSSFYLKVSSEGKISSLRKW